MDQERDGAPWPTPSSTVSAFQGGKAEGTAFLLAALLQEQLGEPGTFENSKAPEKQIRSPIKE